MGTISINGMSDAILRYIKYMLDIEHANVAHADIIAVIKIAFAGMPSMGDGCRHANCQCDGGAGGLGG